MVSICSVNIDYCMNYLQQYVRKEIKGLVAGRERVASVERNAGIVVRKEPTPFVKSWSQSHIWKTYDRSTRQQQK